jgi:glycosyltransferase involved in cell wall biosynthesis
MGSDTRLYFVGDPALPATEARESGNLILRRLCQPQSQRFPKHPYDGMWEKLAEWDRTAGAAVLDEVIGPVAASGGRVVILAEEWQTAPALTSLMDEVRRRGHGGRVQAIWNANNTYEFGRIDWARLRGSASIWTVSRAMRQVMSSWGVQAHLMPNGVPGAWLAAPRRADIARLREQFRGRLALVKCARWDRDKGWMETVDAVARLKSLGVNPLLVARGGHEPYGDEVLARAATCGLSVARVQCEGTAESLAAAVSGGIGADVVLVESYLNDIQRRPLFAAADAVLANSSWEPFGLVGLETMCVGGLAVIGNTGEDYGTPGVDCIGVQSPDAGELARRLAHLAAAPEWAARVRAAARVSARRYEWEPLIEGALLPSLGLVMGADGAVKAAA